MVGRTTAGTQEVEQYSHSVPIARVGRRWIDKFSNQKAAAILNLKMALEDKHREEETEK